MINTFNEQMQYHYNQRTFVNEMLEMVSSFTRSSPSSYYRSRTKRVCKCSLLKESDDIPAINLNFYDNKTALDNLLTKPDGLFYIIDDASRMSQDQDLIMGNISNMNL